MWRRALSRFIGLVALLSGALCAQVPVPPLSGHVVDQTRTLTAEQKQTLEQILSELESRKGSQLAVLLVPTTQPETIEQYALRVAEQATAAQSGPAAAEHSGRRASLACRTQR